MTAALQDHPSTSRFRSPECFGRPGSGRRNSRGRRRIGLRPVCGRKPPVCLRPGQPEGGVSSQAGGLSHRATRFPGLTQAFQYDPIGNRTQWTQGGDANGDNTRVFQFTHDPLNRLLQSTPSDPYDVTGAAPASAAVTIDGQPAQRQGEWFRGEFDAPNQTSAVYPTNIVQVVESGVTNTASVATFVPPETLAYQHDADGNLTRDARWDYAWDAENRLIRVSTRADLPPEVPRVTTAFTYDAAGRRIRKLVTDAVGATVSDLRYLWHQNHLLAEFNGQLLPLRTYTWGPDISGTFDGAAGAGGLYNINGVSGDNGPLWGDYAHIIPAHDGRGNIIGLGRLNLGELWAQFEYDPYGRTVSEKFYPGASAHVPKIHFRYNTRLTDRETGLVYYRFRHYSPHLGRWLNRDPIGEAGGLNLFGMVGNDPVNRLDPLGLEEWDEMILTIPKPFRPSPFDGLTVFSDGRDGCGQCKVEPRNELEIVSQGILDEIARKEAEEKAKRQARYAAMDAAPQCIIPSSPPREYSDTEGEWVNDYQSGYRFKEYGPVNRTLANLLDILNSNLDPAVTMEQRQAMHNGDKMLDVVWDASDLAIASSLLPKKRLGQAGFKHLGSKGSAEVCVAAKAMASGGDDVLRIGYDSSVVPHQAGTIRSFITRADEMYYRVFSGDSTTGAFLSKTKPRSADWAIEAFALPPGNRADFIQEVVVPAGTRLQRSRAAPNIWGRGGAEQFEILKLRPNEFQPVQFGPGVPFRQP